jgi:hypothetical protein
LSHSLFPYLQRSFNETDSDDAYFEEDDDDDEDDYGPQAPSIGPAPAPTKPKPKMNYFQTSQSNLSTRNLSVGQNKKTVAMTSQTPSSSSSSSSSHSSLSLISDLYTDLEEEPEEGAESIESTQPTVTEATPSQPEPSSSSPREGGGVVCRSSEEEFDSLPPLRSKFISDDDDDDDHFAHVFLRGTSPHQSNAAKTNKSSHSVASSGNGSNSAGISFSIMNKKQVSLRDSLSLLFLTVYSPLLSLNSDYYNNTSAHRDLVDLCGWW